MKKVFFLLLFSSYLLANNTIIDRNGIKYLSNKIIVKFDDQIVVTGLEKVSLPQTVQSKLDRFGIQQSRKLFHPLKNHSEQLNKIVEFEIASPFDPMYLAEKISKMEEIAWAEPIFVNELALTPNDSSFSQQYALQKVQAESAWDITTGSPNIIIAIVDTGIDWDHPDLAANIWINEDEVPDNGIDDDGNGYVDDVRGWDFGGLSGIPDNNPMEDRPDHGTHVAGIASAVTNNGTGVAGIGFNCKLMPVKTSQDNIRSNTNQALISYGYEGIVYAVDNGADVINCSWGSNAFSNAAQAVIDYAVANGVLVVGAAGNEGNDEVIYPGRYNGALSVGYSNQGDQKDFSSNYGRNVDVFAPGAGIYNTWQNDTYAFLNGSSMASPLVAGIAGLVKDRFPNYTPLQIAEQIRVTTDNIDAQNPGRAYLLGSGRVNAFKAVSTTDAKSVRSTIVSIEEVGDGDGIFESGESGTIEVEFMNYLNPTTGLTIQLVTDNSFVTITNGTLNAGTIGQLQTFENSNNKFSFSIASNSPLNNEVYFRLEYNDGSYSGFEWIESIVVNPLYKTQDVNDVALTVTSKGTLGFNDYPTNQQGSGFKFMNGPNLLFEGGLMYGTSKSKVVSSVRAANVDFQSNEFQTVQPFLTQRPGPIADEQGFTIFNDNVAGSKSLGIETELHTYSFADEVNRDYIILQYIFKNNTSSEITNFYAGLYFDWDIDENDYNDNMAAYDAQGNFGYVFNSDNIPVDTKMAMILLSEGNYGFYGIHNNGDDGGIAVYDDFTDTEKWTTLTNGLNKTGAGPYDISSVASAGPFTIAANGQLTVAFALAAAATIEELRTVADQSRVKYNSLVTGIDNESTVPFSFSLDQNYPNPFNPTTTIKFSLPKKDFVKLKVYDLLGREVKTLFEGELSRGEHSVNFAANDLASGVYIYRLVTDKYNSTKKMILLR